MIKDYGTIRRECGCMPGYHLCDEADKLKTQLESLYRQGKNKKQDDPVWIEYRQLRDEYMTHMQVTVAEYEELRTL